MKNLYLFLSVVLFGHVAFPAESEPFVLKREGWSFDRSKLNFYEWAKPEEQKAKGEIKEVAGWTEFDFEVPADGWYELWERGWNPEWTRTIKLDGQTVFWHAVSYPDDNDSAYKGFKEGNLWLSKGKHTLHFERTTWPGDLPDSWELRAAQGNPAGSIKTTVKENVVRSGEKIPVTFLGGTNSATSYELLIRDSETGESSSAGKVDFPAGIKPVERQVEVVFPREGTFYLLAKIGNQLLRPADLKAGLFVVVGTKLAAKPPEKLETKTIIDIDCAAEPPKEGFWEKDGKSRVVEKPFGRYRESSGLGKGKDGYWGTDGFSYKAQLPATDRLYRLRVMYPDDDRRSMGFWINDGSAPTSNAAAYTNTGGVETGDQYPLTQKMQMHESFFYPQGKDQVIIAVINLVPDMKAAASRITIDLVENGLPAAPLGKTRGRVMGFYFEESGRWRKFFGGDNNKGISQDMKSLDRWAQWNRYLGANLMFPTINVYQANHYPSQILDGYFSRPINEVRLCALTAEKYQGEFVPEFHLTGQDWFDREIMGVWEERRKEGAKELSEVKFASPEVEEMIIRDRDGNTKHSYEPFMYNALNPKVQEKYISILGELADTLGDSPAFTGISSRMMFTWQWQGWNALPNLSWGYDDWTVNTFQKETGIQVPGVAGDAGRFRERYLFLTGSEKKSWIAWRCSKIFDYHKRMLARIQKARPEAKLVFNWFPLDERHALSTDMLSQMEEVGMDWHSYTKEENIVIIPPGGTYGRRYSIPTSDASKVDGVYDPSIQKVGRLGGRAYGFYSDYYELNKNMDWSQLGGLPFSAFDAGQPSGLNERGMYAQAMADCDTGFLSNGGSGWIFGTPRILQAFFREYRALPAVPFEPWDKARDPVAVWSHRDAKGTLWFYAVNRLAIDVKISIGLKQGEVFSAPGDEKISLEQGKLGLTLEPFMMKSFRAEGGASLVDFQADIPPAYKDGLKPLMTFARQMKEDVGARRLVPEFSKVQAGEAIACLDGALQAFDRGEYFHARGLLERVAAVQVYYLSGKYPPSLWQRSQNHGTPALVEKPAKWTYELKQGSGSLKSISGLSYDTKGNLWLGSAGQVIALDTSGKKISDLSLFEPYDLTVGDIRKTTLVASKPLLFSSLCTAADGALLFQQGTGAPLRYESGSGRLLPLSNKVFMAPGLPLTLLTVTSKNETVISCGAPGKKGIYLYNADGTLKQKISESEALSGDVDTAGTLYLYRPDMIELIPGGSGKRETIKAAGFSRICVSSDGKTILALESKTNRVSCFRKTGSGKWSPSWNEVMPAPVAAMDLSAFGVLAVAFKSKDKDALVRGYELQANGLKAGSELLKSTAETESLDSETRLKAWQGKLYYFAYGKLMRLAPGDGAKAEVAFDPQFKKDQVAFESFAFAPNGDLYLSSNWNGKTRGLNVFLCRKTGTGWDKPEALNQGAPLWEGGAMQAADMESDGKDGLVLRLKNDSAKGQNLSIYRWSPDGSKQLWVDLGDSNGDGEFAIQRTEKGGFLIAGGSTRKILSLSPEGKTLWMTERLKSSPPGYSDLRLPVAIAEDSKGDIWVTDPSRHEIIKLSREGKLLGAFGSFGKSETSGEFFLNRPSGIAAVKDSAGKEWIYVVDAGNRRLVKWARP